jgi:hypothetical protein
MAADVMAGAGAGVGVRMCTAVGVWGRWWGGTRSRSMVYHSQGVELVAGGGGGTLGELVTEVEIAEETAEETAKTTSGGGRRGDRHGRDRDRGEGDTAESREGGDAEAERGEEVLEDGNDFLEETGHAGYVGGVG